MKCCTYVVLLLVVAILAGCGNNFNRVFSEKDLASQFYSIDINRDTILRTANGATLNIPKGSISSKETVVKLEIKEAYNVADMLAAGLTTKSGKEPLSSGGMIYINPAVGSGASIAKPIAVSIPTKNKQDGMQLYKGNKQSDGTIDWTNPEAVPPKINDTLEKGKLLYSANCAACHHPLKTVTGPPLAFLDKRRDWKWLTQEVRMPGQMIAEGDELAVCIYNQFNKTAPTCFPDLTDDDIHLIFAYVDYQARNTDPATIPDFKKSFDSCALYNKLTKQMRLKKRDLTTDDGKLVNIKVYSPRSAADLPDKIKISVDTASIETSEPTAMDIIPSKTYSSAYQIAIQQWGWYNIDILFQDVKGFENSELTARITGEYRNELNLFLVIPDQKIILDGGILPGKQGAYAFYTDDGKIPLPQKTNAVILAMGEHDGKLYFGKTEFTTALKQSPQVMLSAVTKEQMNIEFKKLNIADLDISVKERMDPKKAADTVKEINIRLAEFENIKPKFCDCDCSLKDGGRKDSTTAIRRQ